MTHTGHNYSAWRIGWRQTPHSKGGWTVESHDDAAWRGFRPAFEEDANKPDTMVTEGRPEPQHGNPGGGAGGDAARYCMMRSRPICTRCSCPGQTTKRGEDTLHVQYKKQSRWIFSKPALGWSCMGHAADFGGSLLSALIFSSPPPTPGHADEAQHSAGGAEPHSGLIAAHGDHRNDRGIGVEWDVLEDRLERLAVHRH